MIVSSNISALKLTLKEILHIEDAIAVIRKAMGNYFDERQKLLSRGEKFLNGYNQKLSELYKKHGEGSTHPAILAFADEGKKHVDKEINEPLAKLGEVEIEVNFDQPLYETFIAIFSKGAFFGGKGYNDNDAGKAAFARTIRALGINQEDLKANAADEKVEEKKK